jgi:hypothetical protein
MPARPTAKFRCFCIICISSCSTGPDGAPLGNLISESQRISHLVRAKAETEARRRLQESNLQNPPFPDTLTNDDSTLHAQSSRSRISHEDYQTSASNVFPKAPPINTIVESFQFQDSTPAQSIPQSYLPFEFEVLPFNTITEGLQHLEPEVRDSTQLVPATPLSESSLRLGGTSKRSTQHLSKRERSHLTTSAHRTLDYVENQTSRWLLDTPLTVNTLADAENDIGRIQAAFDSVKRDVHSLNVRKIIIAPKLAQLQSRLVEWHHLYVDDKPLQFNSGTCLYAHIVNYRTKIHVKITIIIRQLISMPPLHS